MKHEITLHSGQHEISLRSWDEPLVLSGLVLRNSADSPAVVPQGRPHFPECAQRAWVTTKGFNLMMYLRKKHLNTNPAFKIFKHGIERYCKSPLAISLAKVPDAVPVGAWWRNPLCREISRVFAWKGIARRGQVHSISIAVAVAERSTDFRWFHFCCWCRNPKSSIVHQVCEAWCLMHWFHLVSCCHFGCSGSKTCQI